MARFRFGAVALAAFAAFGCGSHAPPHPSAPIPASAILEAPRAERLRAASPPLREAEATSCRGLSRREIEESPFAHADALVAVAPSGADPSAFTITMKRVPGLTEERLLAQIECQLARYAAMDSATAEMTDCPLSVPGVKATVMPHSTGLVVILRNANEAAFIEMRDRAERLVFFTRNPGSPAPSLPRHP